jgi:hypothetical protein
MEDTYYSDYETNVVRNSSLAYVALSDYSLAEITKAIGDFTFIKSIDTIPAFNNILARATARLKKYVETALGIENYKSWDKDGGYSFIEDVHYSFSSKVNYEEIAKEMLITYIKRRRGVGGSKDD